MRRPTPAAHPERPEHRPPPPLRTVVFSRTALAFGAIDLPLYLPAGCDAPAAAPTD